MDLVNACIDGDTIAVNRYLNKGIGPNTVSKSGEWTVLMLACRFGYLDIVSLLLKAGANPNYTTFYMITPLMTSLIIYDVYKPDHTQVEIAKELIKAGADINAKDNRGKTVLDKKIDMYHNYTDYIRILLMAGATISKQNILCVRHNSAVIENFFNKVFITVLLRSSKFLNKDLVRHIWEFL